MNEKLNVGFAVCGSFCTFETVFKVLVSLSEKYNIFPIMSQMAYSTDTRFGKAENFIKIAETASGKSVIHTIEKAEPIGPKALLDALIIAPCTGNTIAKIACGITDTPVTMAAKAHLRNARPLIIAVSTNDGLSANAKNIGALQNLKNVYIVPYRQDDPIKKATSLVSDMSLIESTMLSALKGIQIQPIILN